MRAIVTLITTAAFVLHFALGCCAHHAHAAEGMVCPDHAKVAAHDQNCHDHDGNDHDSQEPCEQSSSDSECPAQHCGSPHCVFMAAGKTVVAKTAFTAVLPPFVAEPASFASLSPLAVAAIDTGGLIALPVRPHLFHRVLLI